MAPLYSDGRVLLEWPAADMDWLVSRTPAALVSCRDRVPHARTRACPRLYVVPAASLAHRLLLHRDAVANRRHPHGELHIPQLSRARTRNFPARRSIPAAIHSRALETRASYFFVRANGADRYADRIAHKC